VDSVEKQQMNNYRGLRFGLPGFVLASGMFLFWAVGAMGQSGATYSPFDGLTPKSPEPGSPAGSYVLSGFNQVQGQGAPSQSGSGNRAAVKYIPSSSVPSDWLMALVQYGDRLQRPGKERIVLSGTVTRPSAHAAQFLLTRELPNSVRYVEQGGPNATVIVFDGNQYGKAKGALKKQDSDLIETLAYDSPDWFFYLPSNGVPVRKLGSRFRLEDPKRKGSALAVYDVYLVMDSIRQPGKIKQQAKYYHINSETHNLERIRYADADSPGTSVEIALDGWTTVSGNRVPGSIRRLENGVEVLRLTIQSAVLGPAMPDNAFRNAGN
jgi:hypothetical protein